MSKAVASPWTIVLEVPQISEYPAAPGYLSRLCSRFNNSKRKLMVSTYLKNPVTKKVLKMSKVIFKNGRRTKITNIPSTQSGMRYRQPNASKNLSRITGHTTQYCTSAREKEMYTLFFRSTSGSRRAVDTPFRLAKIRNFYRKSSQWLEADLCPWHCYQMAWALGRGLLIYNTKAVLRHISNVFRWFQIQVSHIQASGIITERN